MCKSLNDSLLTNKVFQFTPDQPSHESLIRYFEGHLHTIDTALYVVGGFTLIIAVLGVLAGWKWWSLVEHRVNSEINKYMQSNEFKEILDKKVQEEVRQEVNKSASRAEALDFSQANEKKERQL